MADVLARKARAANDRFTRQGLNPLERVTKL